ncbi:MAG: hypothetical protein GX214_05270 [Clostridiales bacterium]|nr:hypothetical protein [Clostridiales bacterium]
MYIQKQLVIVIITILLTFTGCSNQKSNTNVVAEHGIMDISQIHLNKSIVRLDGQWEF